MTTLNHRQMKRYHIENHRFDYPISKKIKQEIISNDWSLQKTRKKLKKIHDNQHFEQEYFCQVYLKFYPSTLKCSLDVLVQTNHKFDHQNNSILIGKTRIGKVIKSGVIRVRLVSSLFSADNDVHEDPSLIKLETISTTNYHFDKQFALLLKNNQIGPGPIGKLFVESLDPSNGSYTSNPPIFELNLNLESEHRILLTSSYQTIENEIDDNLFECGCRLSSCQSRLIISDKCNLKLDNTKLVHRLSEPIRSLWKSIGRELFPCFSENDLIDINQRYFLSDGNHECTYQLIREWFIRQPEQANIRYLLTRLKLPFDLIQIIHNDILKSFISS